MYSKQKKIAFIGAGGFGREVFASMKSYYLQQGRSIEDFVFMDSNQAVCNKKLLGIDVIHLSEFNANVYKAVVTIGDPLIRKKIIEILPDDTEYERCVHPTAIIMEDNIIDEGCIITAGCIITTHVRIGKHCHINLNTTIGHDCIIADYFTTAPGVGISGECNIGDCVYFGTNSSVRQGITICDNVVIGMGASVVKNIFNEGVYVGNPAKEMIK